VVLLLLPGLIAVMGSRWMASKTLRPWILDLVGSSEAHNTTSAWNQLFSKQGPCLVRATLTDGRIIGGLYDDRSVTGYSEQVPDLYLSQRWRLDSEDWFAGPIGRSLGVWLASESIVTLEFYDIRSTCDLEREILKIRS
jgi:hypothetical protein